MSGKGYKVKWNEAKERDGGGVEMEWQHIKNAVVGKAERECRPSMTRVGGGVRKGGE